MSASEPISFEVIKTTADFLLERVKQRPKIGIICGTGLGSLAENLENSTIFDYKDIPNFPISTVKGHSGRLVFGLLDEVQVVCMQGRFHGFEGYPLWKCVMPVRLMKMIGITHLIVTNAAGGINSKFRVGDFMIIKDHINLLGIAGNNPLNGPNDDRFGPRFPPLIKAYDPAIRAEAKKMSEKLGIEDIVHEGVYTCVGGPNFETTAELQMLKMLGTDAVGMSTVPEVLAAKHSGLTVFGISLITNTCSVDYNSEIDTNHDEVLGVGKERDSIFKKLITNIVLFISEKSHLNGRD